MNQTKSLSEILYTHNDASEQKSLSWANIVDEEITKHIENKKLVHCKIHPNESQIKKNNDNNITYNLDDILASNCDDLSDLVLLEYQTYIANDIRKYIKQSSDKKDIFDYSLCLKQIEWLSEVSKLFNKKINLTIQYNKILNITNNNTIPRSSYKFCEYGHECVFKYQTKNKPLRNCYAQHFVHNLVYIDIITLKNYLIFSQKNNQNLEINYGELNKCINTILFVINHMYVELQNIELNGINLSNEKYKITRTIKSY